MFHYFSKEDLELLFNDTESVTVLIDIPIEGKRKLIDFLSGGVNSPYYGDNWDGICEVLRDMCWIPTLTIRIIHCALPNLSAQDFKIYLSILHIADDFWINDAKEYPDNYPPMHKLEIYFLKEFQPVIDKYSE